MAFKVAVIVATALGASPNVEVHNPTRKSELKAEPVIHTQANRSKLAAVHSSASVTKKGFSSKSDVVKHEAVRSEHLADTTVHQEKRDEKAAHHQNKTAIVHVLNSTKGSTHQNTNANATKPTWGARVVPNAALREKAPMATGRITMSDPMNYPGVHAYPMVRSKAKTVTKKAVTYHVERRSAPQVVATDAVKGQCECEFEGICETQPAMSFMSCLQNACNSGNDCQCEENQYQNACHQLGDACKGTELQLTCFPDRTDAVMLKASNAKDEAAEKEKAEKEAAAEKEKAIETEKAAVLKAEAAAEAKAAQKAKEVEETHQVVHVEHKTVSWSSTAKPMPVATHRATTATTTMEPVAALYADLERQKEELCGLSLSHDAGFLNAAAHKDLLKAEIAKNIQDLDQRCKELPEMHCEKDFHEYSAPREECGVEVNNEFTRNAFKRGGSSPEPSAKEKSGCVAAIPALSVAALVAVIQ